MIPSPRWFPTSLADRAVWFQNFAKQFSIYAIDLGFVAADVTAMTKLNADFQSIATTTAEVKQYEKSIIEYRISLTEGDIGDPHPVFPTGTFTAPPNDSAAGMFEAIDRWRTKILASDTYTDEIGVAMGIVPTSGSGGGGSGDLFEQILKPVIKASESFSNYSFNVDVTRLGQPGYRIEIQRAGSSTWEIVAFATTNPCLVTITHGTNDAPIRVLVRAVLLKNNVPVGEPSDPTYVTANP